MLKAVIKRRAYEDIVHQIRTLMEKGRWKKGEQLPNEREMAETFKVSRATVREAMLSLQTMNLVQRRQGGGTYVIASSQEALVHPLAASLFQDRDDLIDIFFLRKIIEPEIAQLASENAAAEDLRDLDEILKEQESQFLSDKDPVAIDTEFHHLLARMARNRVLERLLLALYDLLGNTRAKYLQSRERKMKSLQGHREIVRAMIKKDSRGARSAMRRHLDTVEAIVFKKGKGKEVQRRRGSVRQGDSPLSFSR